MMQMQRSDVLDALDTIKPAISTKSKIEELKHVWFTGDSIIAYNDAELGIRVPLESPFKGGVQGSLLFGLLNNSRAKNITLEPVKKDDMLMKAGSATLTFQVLPLEIGEAIWSFPKFSKKKATEFDDAFIEALNMVMVAVGNDAVTPEARGITIEDEDGLSLYATDTNCIATISVKGMDEFAPKQGKRKVMPTAFCNQLTRLCPDGGHIQLFDECVVALNSAGVLIYSRLLEATNPLPMAAIIARATQVPKGARFAVPDRLSAALDRMQVLFEGKSGIKMRVKIIDGKFMIDASVSGRGSLKDKIKVPESVPEVSFRTEPKLISRALGLVNEMSCTQETILMTGENGFIYLVSNAGD